MRKEEKEVQLDDVLDGDSERWRLRGVDRPSGPVLFECLRSSVWRLGGKEMGSRVSVIVVSLLNDSSCTLSRFLLFCNRSWCCWSIDRIMSIKAALVPCRSLAVIGTS